MGTLSKGERQAAFFGLGLLLNKKFGLSCLSASQRPERGREQPLALLPMTMDIKLKGVANLSPSGRRAPPTAAVIYHIHRGSSPHLISSHPSLSLLLFVDLRSPPPSSPSLSSMWAHGFCPSTTCVSDPHTRWGLPHPISLSLVFPVILWQKDFTVDVPFSFPSRHYHRSSQPTDNNAAYRRSVSRLYSRYVSQSKDKNIYITTGVVPNVYDE